MLCWLWVWVVLQEFVLLTKQ
eukprot:COSAG06_NODE_66611_length_254_cov_0.535484_1_plen_20_part_01